MGWCWGWGDGCGGWWEVVVRFENGRERKRERGKEEGEMGG